MTNVLCIIMYVKAFTSAAIFNYQTFKLCSISIFADSPDH